MFKELHAEFSAAEAKAAALSEELAAERNAHCATKKVLAAALAREAKLKAQLAQRGPVDSETESWLMARQATCRFDRSPARGESVTVRLLRGGGARGKTLDEAITELRERFGGER